MNKIAGIISDTHGLLRPEVFQVFKNVDVILHAGDIGSPEILKELNALAPIIAVRGNNDKGDWANTFPEVQKTHLGSVAIYMLHDRNELDLGVHPPDVQVLVSGHSHRPSIERREGTLFVNPGSAGPRRFKLPISVARLIIHGANVTAELIELPNTAVIERRHDGKRSGTSRSVRKAR